MMKTQASLPISHQAMAWTGVLVLLFAVAADSVPVALAMSLGALTLMVVFGWDVLRSHSERALVLFMIALLVAFLVASRFVHLQ